MKMFCFLGKRVHGAVAWQSDIKLIHDVCLLNENIMQ